MTSRTAPAASHQPHSGGAAVATLAGRPMPPTAAVLELETVAARCWPATEVEERDGWLLRAAGGFTGRANSAVPVTEAAVAGAQASLGRHGGIPDVVARIARWYRDRDLPPRLALPIPPMEDLRARLDAHGWTGRGPILVMTAAAGDVLAACGVHADLPEPHVSERTTAAWRRGYARGAEFADPRARTVVEGGGARFATLHFDDEVAAIVRRTVDGPWLGIAALEVAPRSRRRGLAQHLLAWGMRDGMAQGATHAWLQVDAANQPAVALYRRVGFEVHHVYRYAQPQGADT